MILHMLIRLFFQSVYITTIMTMIVISLIGVSDAQVRTSDSYQIQRDSINIGGGYSTSDSYIQESTVGEIATGLSDSSTYSIYAGYQQALQDVSVSLLMTGDVIMSPDLAGITGGTSNGSTTITVTTDSPSGYQLTISAEGNPAMQGALGGSIDDYDAGIDPDFSFLIGGGDAYFGFSPDGVDVVQAFLDDGGICNTGSLNTSLACWDGLTTSDTVVASAGSSNQPNGATTTLNFRVGIGSGAGVIADVYTATTTVTAIPL